jgi:hypothetical protein
VSQRATQAEDAQDGSVEPGAKPRAGRAVRVLVAFVVGLVLLVTLVVVLVVAVLPHLARRGDLNAHVEAILRDIFTLEIKVASVETDPLSRLAITHITGLRADSTGSSQLAFSCERVSVLYSPIDLWLGKIKGLALVRPRISVNLDEELEGLISNWPPDSEVLSGAPGTPPQVEDGEGDSAFAVGHFSLEDGDFSFQYVGQDFHLHRLNVEIFGLGTREALTFDLESKLGDATLDAAGEILPRRDGDEERTYDIPKAEIGLEGFDLAPLVGLVEKMLPGFDVGGHVDLKGSVEGTWPKTVKVDLSTDWQVDRGTVPVPDLEGARLGLRFNAMVTGALEHVDFDLVLSLVAGERAATLTLRGRYETDIDGGVVFFEEGSALESTGLGSVTIRGSIGSLLEDPDLDIKLRLDELDFQRTKETPVLGVFLDRLDKIHGRGALALEVRGPISDPIFQGGFSLPDGKVALTQDRALSASVRGGFKRVSNVFNEDGPHVDGASVVVSSLRLEELVQLAEWDADNLDISGTLEVEVAVSEIRPPAIPEEWGIQVQVDDFAVSILEGTIATENASIRGTLKAKPVTVGGQFELQTKGHLELRAPLLIVGDAAEDLSDEVVTLQAYMTMKPVEPGRDGSPEAELYDAFFTIQLLLPSLGPVELTGTATIEWSPDLDVRRLDLLIRAQHIPNRDFLSIYLGKAHEEALPFLVGSTFDGLSTGLLNVRKEGEVLEVNGRLTSSMDSVRLPAIDLSIDGLELDLPLRIGNVDGDAAEPTPEGRLTFETCRFGVVEVEDIDLPLRLDAENSRLESRGTAFGFLGGRAEVSKFWLDWSDGSQAFDVALKIDGADLQALMRSAGWSEGVGRLNARVESLTVIDDSLRIEGKVDVEGFSGRLSLTDLVVENYSMPYFTLWLGSGEVRDLDLRELGATLDFGLMSGILDGNVEDLELSANELLRFRLDLETDRRPDVEQFINKNAIRSLRGLLAPFSAFEDLFFSKFYYEGFGFTAELEDGRFRMRGKYDIDGVEYLMYSKWWQIPCINIINGNPEQDYDWDRVQAHVKGFFDTSDVEKSE